MQQEEQSGSWFVFRVPGPQLPIRPNLLQPTSAPFFPPPLVSTATGQPKPKKKGKERVDGVLKPKTPNSSVKAKRSRQPSFLVFLNSGNLTPGVCLSLSLSLSGETGCNVESEDPENGKS